MKPRIAKELQRVVYELGPANLIDWARALGEAFPQTRHVTPDYLRLNRRFPNRVGEIPGRRRRPPKRRLLVAIDTSGSMYNYVWPTLLRKIEETLNLYPKVKGFQVMNDEGVYMFPSFRGKWRPDTPVQITSASQ
jgi:predicted metal-dependent peptidase